MNVLFFSRNFGAATTTFIRNEVDYLLEHTHFRYLCQELQPGAQGTSYLTTIPFQENPFSRKIRWKLWEWDWACNFSSKSYAKKVRDYVDAVSPDIIHCHFAYEALMLLDNIDVKKYKIVIHFHGYDASQMLRKQSYTKRLKELLELDNVYPVTVSHFFKDALSFQLEVPADKFRVLYCGVDLGLFDPTAHSLPRQATTFVQVSSLASKKGHEYTLRAFAMLVKQMGKEDLRLVITGDGERKDILENLAETLGVRPQVVFTGMVSPIQAVRLLAEADVFLHHSITPANGDTEGIPTAIMEAMAMELPVVSTWHSGIPELVEDGLNGYLVKEKDVEAYALKMGEALSMGRLPANRIKISEHFNKERHNQQLAAIYQQVAGEPALVR